MTQNMIVFRPETDRLQVGIRAARVLHDDGTIRHAISLARLQPQKLKSGKTALMVPKGGLIRTAFESLETPPVIKDGIFLEGAVTTTRVGERRHYIGTRHKGSGIVVEIDSGLWGNDFERNALFGLMPKGPDGQPVPLPHGSFDLSGGGAELIADASEEHAVPKSYHVSWSFSGQPLMVPSTKGTVKVFPRWKDLWVLNARGGEIVVGGCIPNTLFRLINDGGELRKEHLTTVKAQAGYDELVWQSEQARLAREATKVAKSA